MTSIQALFSQHLENVRHNKAMEQISQGELEQKVRQTDETIRHNVSTEGLSAADLKEKIRHQQAQDTETMRHNRASEEEIANHNRVVESLENARNNITLKLGRLNAQVQEKIARDKNFTAKEIAAANRDMQKYVAELNAAINSSKNVIEKDKLSILKQQANVAEQRMVNDYSMALKNFNLNKEKWDLQKVYEGIDSVSSLISSFTRLGGAYSPSRPTTANRPQTNQYGLPHGEEPEIHDWREGRLN